MNGSGVDQLLLELKASDVQIRLVDDRLQVNAPKQGMSSDLREELSARKQEIIDFFKAAKPGRNNSIPELVAANDSSPAPLSFGQQRIWVLHELNKERASPYDTISFNFRLQGNLNVDALRHSLTQIVNRHEILRTVVAYNDERPEQKILPADEVALEIEDFADRPDEDPEEYARQMLTAAKRVFLEPSTGPLFQTRLIKIDERDHLLIFSIHHMVFDEWSSAILIRELIQFYDAFLQGEMQPLPRPILQYGDFARWQRAWLQGEELTNHLKLLEKQA